MRRLLLLLLLIPSLAHADAREDARRLFHQGMDLVASGAHLEGAHRLEAAYEALPHPSVLYNIGLAYADAGEIDTALGYFRRYIDSNPDDGAAVEQVITLLQKQKVEAATPVVVPPSTAEPTDAAASSAPSAPSASSADLEAILQRLDELSDRLDGEAAPEQAITDDVIAPEALERKSSDDIYVDRVVSASRSGTSSVDAPAATTIITADEIRLSGVTNIPDLLRRVPGMSILTMGSGNANMAMRGFNQRISNKLLVLVDGRSVWFDFLGGNFLRALSIDLNDIERIEVIHGPGSTLYGANAFGGVVNIILKAPGDDPGGQVAITGGTGETLNGNVRFSGRKGIVGFRGSVGYEQTNRYEKEFDVRSDYVAQPKDPDLAVRALRANGAVMLKPADDLTIGISGGLNYLFDNFFAIGVFRDFYLEGLNSDLRVDFGFKGLKVRAWWNHLNVREAGPTWAHVGGLNGDTTPLSNTVDVEAAYVGQFMTGPIQHDLSVGASYRLKAIDWNYIAEPQLEQHLAGFVEDRVTFLPQLSLTAGFRFDQHPLVGFTPSPRAALLVKPTPRQSIRLSAGTAFRTPTFLESYLDLTIPTGLVTGVALSSRGNLDLQPENIVAIELGYVFQDSDYVHFDINAYYERVDDLIALGAIVAPDGPAPLEGEFFIAGSSTFENATGVFHGVGGEASVHAFPVLGLDVRASYSLAYWIDQAKRDAGEAAQDIRHPMHMGNFGVSYRAPFGLDANVDFHAVSAVSIPERTFASDGTVLIEPCDASAYPMVSARIGYRLPKDRLEFAVTGFNLTAFGDGGHREHCLATNVGARVLGTAIYRF